MATIKELEAQLAQLDALLRQHGIFQPTPTSGKPKARADYIEFGGAAHMALLGLVKAKPGDEEIFITHKSGGKTYRLEDEITTFMHYTDPKQVAAMVLRSKINVLESGKPAMPSFADAPLWTPEPMDGREWEQKQYAVMA